MARITFIEIVERGLQDAEIQSAGSMFAYLCGALSIDRETFDRWRRRLPVDDVAAAREETASTGERPTAHD